MTDTVHIKIKQGETFRIRYQWVDTADPPNPIDVTNYTGSRMQIRQYKEQPDPPEISLTVGSGITLGGADGYIDVVIDSTTTAAIDWDRGVYDLEMVIPGTPEDVTRAVEGRVRVSREVTR